MTRGATHKSDIYSFGVVLFEILCKRNAFVQKDKNNDTFLVSLVKHHYENNNMREIMFQGVKLNEKALVTYSDIAYSCLNEDPTLRPSLERIVHRLEQALKEQRAMMTTVEDFERDKVITRRKRRKRTKHALFSHNF
ncbi:hypothetical protein QVD17_17029 [Tagetes erecta]|uniref:Protein kinase domain-containing protein n=1 Tax=Tagetes erecta TaxID=13708 RepID=A0AAD8KYR1_TARER|nr:hypothetical protein QVD17_17029 [Tagetes erecta]